MPVTYNRNQAIAKLNGMIEQGRDRAHAALVDINNEWASRQDLMVRPTAFDFNVRGNGEIRPVVEDREFALTNHSTGQLLERAALSNDFVRTCAKYAVPDLLRESLRTLLPRVSGEGVLVRHVSEQIKGILSPSFRRMDASPIFEAFVTNAMQERYHPYRGTNTDTRFTVAFIDDQIHEPSPGELVVYGIQLVTGDYGGVALQFAMMAHRIACDNLATGMNILRQIHLGKRFDFSGKDGPIIELSKKTHVLDMRTVASGIGDAVKSSRKYVAAVNDKIALASKREVDIDAAVATMKKKGFRKEVLEEVKTLYNSDLPVEALPQEKSAWRLSNCLSLIAKSRAGDQKHDLESAAFDIVAA